MIISLDMHVTRDLGKGRKEQSEDSDVNNASSRKIFHRLEDENSEENIVDDDNVEKLTLSVCFWRLAATRGQALFGS